MHQWCGMTKVLLARLVGVSDVHPCPVQGSIWCTVESTSESNKSAPSCRRVPLQRCVGARRDVADYFSAPAASSSGVRHTHAVVRGASTPPVTFRAPPTSARLPSTLSLINLVPNKQESVRFFSFGQQTQSMGACPPPFPGATLYRVFVSPPACSHGAELSRVHPHSWCTPAACKQT